MQNLVSPEWLAAATSQRERASDLVILDASMHMPSSGRDAAKEFADGHIPGAQFLAIAGFHDPEGDVGMALPSAAQFAEKMDALGITPQSMVVLYDDSAIKTAARAWFIFRLYGHEQVAILDGGLAAWKAAGQALESGLAESAPAAAPYPVPDKRYIPVRSKADMIGNLSSHAAQVVDARDNARFTGTSEDAVHGLEGGHIPGARNVPFTTLYHDGGTLKDSAALKTLFTDAGVDLDKPIITSCGSGFTACNLLFALNQCGKSISSGEVALYDGSWSDWAADPDTPKETGPAKASV